MHHRLDYHAKNSLREDTDQRRREDINRLPLHLLPNRPLRIPLDVARSPRGRDIHIKREDDRRCPLHLSDLRNRRMILVDTKGLELLHRLQRLEFPCNLRKLSTSIQSVFNQVNIAHDVSENVMQTTKGSGSDSEPEIWSFDRVIPSELCPKTQQEQTPASKTSLWDRIFNGITFYAINCSTPV